MAITPYALEQSDQALERAIAFIQARQAGEISYGRGGRSAGCLIAHAGFRDRWLKVKWTPAGRMDKPLWDGEVLSIALEGISKPRVFGYFDWEAIGICYRAIMMSVSRGLISKWAYPETVPILDSQWWDHLSNAIARIQANQTDRIHVTDDALARRMRERYGLKLKLPVPSRRTAHGDLHWGTLTAPEFSIIDWETWGRAPYGLDVAVLHVFSAAQRELVSTLKEVFSQVMSRPEYDIAYLLAASEAMRLFDLYGHYEALQSDLRLEVARVLEEGRIAEFCE